jgi:hypothetical protein
MRDLNQAHRRAGKQEVIIEIREGGKLCMCNAKASLHKCTTAKKGAGECDGWEGNCEIES